LKMKLLSSVAQPYSRSIRFFIAVSAYYCRNEAGQRTSGGKRAYRKSVPMTSCDDVNQYGNTVTLEKLVSEVLFL
jgi:hypothetical protein